MQKIVKKVGFHSIGATILNRRWSSLRGTLADLLKLCLGCVGAWWGYLIIDGNYQKSPRIFAELKCFWVARSHFLLYESGEQQKGQGCSQNNREERRVARRPRKKKEWSRQSVPIPPKHTKIYSSELNKFNVLVFIKM